MRLPHTTLVESNFDDIHFAVRAVLLIEADKDDADCHWVTVGAHRVSASKSGGSSKHIGGKPVCIPGPRPQNVKGEHGKKDDTGVMPPPKGGTTTDRIISAAGRLVDAGKKLQDFAQEDPEERKFQSWLKKAIPADAQGAVGPATQRLRDDPALRAEFQQAEEKARERAAWNAEEDARVKANEAKIKASEERLKSEARAEERAELERQIAGLRRENDELKAKRDAELQAKKDKAAKAKAKRDEKKAGLKPEEAVPDGTAPLPEWIAKVEQELRTKEIVATENLGGGITDSKKIKFADGTYGVWKSEASARYHRNEIDVGRREGQSAVDRLRAGGGSLGEALHPGIQDNQTGREVGAWEVAKLVGMHDLVTPTIVREHNGQRGAVMAWNEGKMAARATDKYDGARDLQRSAMFDFIIGAVDRHAGNWMVKPDGKLAMIDHGFAFGDRGLEGWNFDIIRQGKYQAQRNKARKEGVWQELVSPYVKHQNKIYAAMKANGLSEKSIANVRKRILQAGNAKGWDDLDLGGAA